MVTDGDPPKDLTAPTITLDVIEASRVNGQDDIVLYPEIVAGNPIGGSNVARYLLNVPGFFTTVGVEGYGPDDFFIHFAEEFRPSGLASFELRLPLIDTDVFHEKPSKRERRGFLLYTHRHPVQLDSLPDWVSPYEIVSMEDPRSPPELAELYNSSEGLVLWERTAALGEAIQCGCPVIIAAGSTFKHDVVVQRYCGNGIAVGWGRDKFRKAQRTVKLAKSVLAGRYENLDDRLHEFVVLANKHFDKEERIRELERNTRRLGTLSQELAAVYSSTSWRAMAPLRFIKKLAGS